MDWDAAGWSVASDRVVVARLGQGSRRPAGWTRPPCMDQAAEAVAGLLQEVRRAGAADVAAAGTMALGPRPTPASSWTGCAGRWAST